MCDDAITLCPLLKRNLEIFRSRLGAPTNADVLIRRFRSGAFDSAILAIDGMTDAKVVAEHVIMPCVNLPEAAGEDVAPSERAAF